MEHMRISGNQPSISNPRPNKVVSKVEIKCPKVAKQTEAIRDHGVMNPQYYSFIQF